MFIVYISFHPGNFSKSNWLGKCCNHRYNLWFTAYDGAWWHSCWSRRRICNEPVWSNLLFCWRLQVCQGHPTWQWRISRLWYSLWVCSSFAQKPKKVLTTPAIHCKCIKTPFLYLMHYFTHTDTHWSLSVGVEFIFVGYSLRYLLEYWKKLG